jgi:hypothetical protein
MSIEEKNRFSEIISRFYIYDDGNKKPKLKFNLNKLADILENNDLYIDEKYISMYEILRLNYKKKKLQQTLNIIYKAYKGKMSDYDIKELFIKTIYIMLILS